MLLNFLTYKCKTSEEKYDALWPKPLTTSTEVSTAQFELNWNVDKDTKRDSSTENVNTLHWSSEDRTFLSDKQVTYVKSEMSKQYTDSIN